MDAQHLALGSISEVPSRWSEQLELEYVHHLDLSGTSEDPHKEDFPSYLGRSMPNIHHAKFINWRTMKMNSTSTAQQRWEENHVPPGVPFCFERKITQDSLCVEIKDAGVPVYIENTQKKQETGTQALFIFYKYKYRFPYMSVRFIACRRWADLTWAKVIFWFPGPRKAPG